jgi:dipeptidyl aminopeptidase/acylaminoacyl peptidase
MGQSTCGAAAPSRMSRWRVAAVVVAAVIVGCGSPPASPPGMRPLTVPAPSVNAAAFGGHGELAFVSRGRLWVLDGATGTLRRVLIPGMTPLDPAFSPDGRWLAFLGSSASHSATSSALWIASGDGRGAHQIRGLATGGLIGWSPVADVLAVTAGPQPAREPYGYLTTVRLVAPSGSVRTLLSAAGIQGAVWSPDGSSIAVATRHWPTATTLASYPVTGGKPVTWLKLNAKRGVLDGMTEVIIDPAGWWPRWGSASGYSATAWCTTLTRLR